MQCLLPQNPTYATEHYTDDYATQRGLEQLMYDNYQPPLNINRPIGPKNSNGPSYLNAAKAFLAR
jgi:hypothetical protein